MSTEASRVLESPAVPFSELAKGNFRAVQDLTLVKDLEYVQQLASLQGADIGQWPVLEILKEVPRGNKRAINKAFFAHSASKQAPPPYDESDEEIQKLFQRARKNQTNYRSIKVGELKRARIHALSVASDYSKNVRDHLKTAREMGLHIEVLENTPKDLEAEVKKILSNPFWEFFASIGDQLIVTTRNDVICCEKHLKSGVDRKVNLGRYRIHLDLKTAAMQVCKHQRNREHDGHIHPYVSDSGNICWGNASDTVEGKLLVEGEFAAVMDLLQGLLTHFASDSTPYVQLRRFEDEDPDVEVDEDHCENCESHVDDCECFHCEICEARTTRPCGTHWCSNCESYRSEGGDDCENCNEDEEDEDRS